MRLTDPLSIRIFYLTIPELVKKINGASKIMLALNIKKKKHGDAFELKDINVEISPSQITLLLGHNGAGKTTIIKSLFGLMDYEGSLCLDDILVNYNSSKGINYLKNNISYISDENALFDYLTPKEYFSLIEKTFNKVDHRMLENFIKIFELERYLNIPIINLSHGNKKKTEIISQLFKKSKYIVFDEPTNGLDPDMVIILRETLKILKNTGRGILLSTHHLSFGEELYDNLIILRNGKLKLNSTRDEIRKRYGDYSLEKIYQEVNEEYYMQVKEILNELHDRDHKENRVSKKI
ncbi:ABC transporter ATP-binding protein [Priestia endophytica]|nr:ABC transporter ATP-binding protein [Priestia endophytica]